MAVFVSADDERADGGLEVFDGGESAAADRLPGDDAKEDLDYVVAESDQGSSGSGRLKTMTEALIRRMAVAYSSVAETV